MKRIYFLIFLTLQLTASLWGKSAVIIHGFMSNAESMRKIQRTLGHSGFCIYVWDYASPKKFLEEHGRDLAASLGQMACEAPGEPIHFVTHSSGALVLRSALNQPHCPQEAKIGRAVLIAPPNRGSLLARNFRWCPIVKLAMGSKTGRQLMYYEPEDFKCFGPFPSTMEVLVIAGMKGNKVFFNGPNDNLLMVEETYLDTPFNFKAMPVSHGDLLQDKKTLQCLRAFMTLSQ